MLGSAIAPYFELQGHHVTKTDIRLLGPDVRQLDVRDRKALREFVSENKPDAIFHLAAETDVDLCEKEVTHAYETNAVATEYVVEVAREFGLLLVYISTAGVFDGRKESPYDEDDIPNPIMVYGRSKLAGEYAVRNQIQRHFVVRAGWMVGGAQRDKKFVMKIIKQLRAGAKEIRAVNDKYGTPTYTEDFAKTLDALIKTDKYGLYHMACGGSGTRYDVAAHIIPALGYSGVQIIPVGSDYFRESYPAPRPRSEMMVNRNLKRAGLDLMRDWKTALSEYIKQSHSNIGV